MENSKCLEDLPDELLLEIYTYLSSYDILYSFGYLNWRIQCIIGEFCSQLDFSHTSLNQFQYMCSSSFLFFLPQRLTKLTLSNGCAPGQIEIFQENICNSYLKEKLPFLTSISLLDFENNNITLLSQLLYLEELFISFTSYEKIKSSTETLLQFYLFTKENNFRKITLDIEEGVHMKPQIKPNIQLQDLNIHLSTVDDLFVLFTIVPNINRLFFSIVDDVLPTFVPQIQFSMDNFPKFLKILFMHTEHKQAVPFKTFFIPLVYNIPSIEHLSFGLKTSDPDYADATLWTDLINSMPLLPTVIFGLEIQITITLLDRFVVYTHDDLKKAVFDLFVQYLPSASLSIYTNQETLYIDTVPYRFDRDTGYTTSPEALRALKTNPKVAQQPSKHIIGLNMSGEYLPITANDYINIICSFPGIKYINIESINVKHELKEENSVALPVSLKLKYIYSLAYMRSTKCQVNRTLFDYLFYGHQRLTTLTMMYGDLIYLLRTASPPLDGSHITNLTCWSSGPDGTVQLNHLNYLITAFPHIEYLSFGLTSSKLIKKKQVEIIEKLITSFERLRVFRLYSCRGTFILTRMLMDDQNMRSKWLSRVHASGSVLIVEPKHLRLWKCESQITYF
ncbi:unnamed protein product [Rotaria sp. Silwood2]|nr:unnamed protein product [Rotaria sp. Silwood2]CAF2977682.1 unnamed protein product [Rotaria sp. Silwood2]CAF3363198.1 unnamed protein product [Rotaria sp. Silwood2]CAF4033007.1 unnamed protein product [Rotaria sp. Silwood2]CAF4153688.1 unnamed protein product [Rotaria sp. Silwood2]